MFNDTGWELRVSTRGFGLLAYYKVNITRIRYTALKAQIYGLDKGRCHICGKSVKYHKAVLDHIIPMAISGRGDVESSDEYWNLRLAHRGCNARRAAALIPGQLRLAI